MLKRFLDHLRGVAIGAALTLAACAWLYIDTHDVKFTSTASNETRAEQTAAAIEDLMPLPQKKPVHP